MLRLYSYTFTWSLFCLGLYFMLHHCDARAVNISNTWTMPQGGLNVFYRFFRDRISWFEADAVCQFHHANLVTVDNSFQFDATRDLLRELDVNDIVWIGLMRPQNSERFIWSNSKPLITDAGYWAESLPLMDAPLCAVIDPIRDYRWHALRCGGPETASFLCEMPVPNWAEACLLKDVSHITMQYMADTASIELIKNCQQEGLLKATCKGKQDREQITQSLKCPSENIEAQQLQGITNSRLKSSQIVNGIATDNNESNNIELLPLQSNNYGSRITSSVLNSENMPTEKNAVQKLIEQFNVDELMQADEPKTQIQSGNDYYKLGAIIPNPVKKSIKKIGELIKKDVAKEKLDSMNEETNQHNHFGNINDKMIADQRANGEPEIVEHILDDVTNEIAEPLPHIKKIRPQDLHTAAIIQEKFHNKDDLKKLVGNDEMKNTKEKNLEESVELSSTIPIYNHNNEKSNVMKHKNQIKSSFKGKQLSGQEEFAKIADSTITIEVEPQWTTTIASITHPIHPQMQPRNIPSHETESQHPLQHNGHVKETPDNSHFIPPMLLVKSHYISNNNRQHSSSHSSTHHDFPEELTHDNKHQLNKNNEKDINEKFSSSVEKSNSMKMAEAIFQNRSDIPATTIAVAAAPPAPPAAAPPAPPAAAAAAATTTTTTTTATKLIVHDYQQGFTPNFVNMTKEKETNADTTNHENNPFTIEHHNDDNNNNSKHNNDTMNEFQELSTTLQIIHSKTAQQKMHKQRQEQEQKQELEQQQELQTKQQQLKLNKYEHIDNESNANGKSSKEVLLQQHQQHENNSNNFAVTTTTTTTTNKNNKFNKKVVLLTTTTTTSALTTNKMHDLVEAKLSQNSPTKSPTTFHTNADKLKEWIMEEHAMTTKVLEEEKAKKREEFKVKTEAATQSELQIKQQENVTPITTVIAAAETTITAIKMEPSLDEKIIVAAQKNVDITEIVTPTKQSAEMLSLTTITETQKQIDDKLDIKMEQKKSLEQMEQMEQTDGIKATIKAEREGEVAITKKLAATSLNGQAASLTNNSSNTSGDVDLVEPTTTTQKAKIEERAIYANTTEDIAAAMASEAHNLKIQSGNADAISATSSELFETSKSTATTITTTAAAAAAAASAIETNFETTMRNFLKLTTEESYKPNRRRALTKPKSVSYIKKILG